MKKLVILKFGGTSVGTPEAIRQVGEIIKNASKNNPVVVVISAFQGVTDQLIGLTEKAKEKKDFQVILENLKIKHLKIAAELLPGNIKKELRINKLFQDIANALTKEITPANYDYILSFGEKLSAFIISEYLDTIIGKGICLFADISGLIVTDNNFQNANINFEKTNRNIYYILKHRIENEIFVITGFIGATEQGETTTLGRGGSDYTASIIGAALNAERIEIWTDVDGIMSADPKIVKNSIVVPNVSYDEAIEAAYFGAKVIYPATMLPAMQKEIPILIKNTFNPQSPGTLISGKIKKSESPVKIITAIDNITIINVKGVKLFGIPGAAERVFRVTKNAQANVILISQASSENSICFAVKTDETEKCVKALEIEFGKEIETHSVEIEILREQTILAAVGDNMKGTPGIAGKLFSALGKNNINITAIAQGSSERNISFVVSTKNAVEALNVAHHTCVRDGEKNIFLIGVGNVGGKVLKLIGDSFNEKIKVIAVINTKKMAYDEKGLNPLYWEKNSEIYKQEDSAISEVKKFEKLKEKSDEIGGEKILVDCSSGEKIAKMYIAFAKIGFNIVTTNKNFNAGSLSQYFALRTIMQETGRQFFYSANVGAGLPIIALIKELKENGSEIKKIEGVFSGTLSYIFNNLNNKIPFSQIVRKTVELGLAEPDPREDLNGLDVAKKMIILSREAGWPKEMNDAKIQNLIPKNLRKLPLAEFQERLRECDKYFQKQFTIAELSESKIRYVATVTEKETTARLVKVRADSPIAQLTHSDNIFLVYTKRHSRPIIIRGEGAGGEITASGVISDILKI